ncbi:MAG: hypothetical protein EBU90_07335 [Proteobacteria bacterium]|nr:hypothetical protein [Pseudomonadota bacterium]NBP13484.1 hypothetical protein [bacterium]
MKPIKTIFDAITVEQQQQIVKHLLSHHFPWYFQEKMLENTYDYDWGKRYEKHGIDNYFFSHTLVTRNGEDPFGRYLLQPEPLPGKVNSDDWDKFKNIFYRNVPEHTIIHRAALNLTFGMDHVKEIPGRPKHCVPHKDHIYKHKSFICYLNKFSDGHTYLMDDDGNITFEIEAKERSAVIFDGQTLHAQGFCKNNEKRLVMVVTYN